MLAHGEGDGGKEPHVGQGTHHQQRLVLTQTAGRRRRRRGEYLEGGQVTEPRAIAEGTGKPVEGIEHLYGDEHGEGHGHGVHVREDTAAVQVSKHLVVFCALEVVALRGGRGGGGGGGGGERIREKQPARQGLAPSSTARASATRNSGYFRIELFRTLENHHWHW